MWVPFELNGWNVSDLEGLGLRSRGVRDSLREVGWLVGLVGLGLDLGEAGRRGGGFGTVNQ